MTNKSRKPNPYPWLRHLPVLIGLIMFGAAIFVMHHNLSTVGVADIRQALQTVPTAYLFAAIILTSLSYLLLTLYDFVGLRYTNTSLAWQTVVSTAFIAFAIGHNVGIAALSGGAIRYRAYSAAGVGATAITQVIASCTVTFSLGVTLLLGFSLLLEPASVLAAAHLPTIAGRYIGIALLCVPVAWLIWSALPARPLTLRNWQIQPPTLPLAAFQIALATVDLIIASSVVWLLLPTGAGISFVPFIGLYVIALTVGLLSNVPGGLGVFEGAMLLLLPSVPASSLLGALLAFRIIYYMLPLVIALAVLASQLLKESDSHVKIVMTQGASVITRAAPQILAIMVFMTGIVLLVSGAVPGQPQRLDWLGQLVPDSLMQLSHLLGSAIGLALLVLARGLYRRLQGAWVLTLWLLGAGIVVSLIKGFDYEESIVMAMAVGMLWVARKRFHRRASLFEMPFTASWLASITMVVGGVIWLGFFVHQHVNYNNTLLWNFAFDAEAPKMLRGSALLALMLVALSLSRLLNTANPHSQGVSANDLELAANIVSKSSSSEANVALSGDKDFLFHPEKDAFIMYRTVGRSAIALGDPIGNTDHLSELVWSFRDLCDRLDLRCVFYRVSKKNLALYIDLGLAFSKLGEEAIIPLASFTLEGKRNAEFRQARNKGIREGIDFSVVPASQVDVILPAMRSVSDNWLARKNVREKGFSIGSFDPVYLARFDTAVVRREGKIIAFANIWPAGDNTSLSVDLMRHHESAPNGIMDYLFVELMMWGKEHGYTEFSLGMAPLSGLGHHPLATMWNRVGNLIFRFGDEFYNFEGLRNYKQKFNPDWQPRYLAAPGGYALPKVLIDITTLISGGIKGVFTR